MLQRCHLHLQPLFFPHLLPTSSLYALTLPSSLFFFPIFNVAFFHLRWRSPPPRPDNWPPSRWRPCPTASGGSWSTQFFFLFFPTSNSSSRMHALLFAVAKDSNYCLFFQLTAPTTVFLLGIAVSTLLFTTVVDHPKSLRRSRLLSPTLALVFLLYLFSWFFSKRKKKPKKCLKFLLLILWKHLFRHQILPFLIYDYDSFFTD